MVEEIAGFFKETYGDQRGWAVICYFSGGTFGKGQLNREVWFHLPEQMDEMAAWAEKHSSWDLYFTPFLWAHKKRDKNAEGIQTRCVYADLDGCDPTLLKVEPSLLWETSPGRHQALWVVTDTIDAQDASELSHGLAYAHAEQGCDKSGWDIGQLLRIPGSTHNKKRPHPIRVPVMGDTYVLDELLEHYEGIEAAHDTLPLTVDPAARESLPDLPEFIRRKLEARKVDDRSGASWDLVSACGEWGLSDGQILTVLDLHAPTQEKLSAQPAWRNAIVASVAKVRSKHPHAGRTCDEASCVNAPRWMKNTEADEVEEFPAIIMEPDGSWSYDGEAPVAPKVVDPGTVPAQRALRSVDPTQVKESPKESPAEAHKRRVREISLPSDLYSTPELESVRYAAQARAAHPDGVLGVMLARVSSIVSPTVTAVTGSGSPISLNLYSGVVSPPGGGKDRSIVAASGLLPFPEGSEPVSWDVGTGEGLIDSYMESSGGDDEMKEKIWIQHHDRVCLFEPEAETLFTFMDRSGSSMPPLLLKMWGGSQVGMGNAKGGGRSRSLLDGSYRYSMLLGFQPEKISALLKRKGVGFPHRFVLFNGIPETRRGAGGQIQPMTQRAEWLASLKNVEIQFPKEILAELEEINEAQLYNLTDPDADGIDSHAFVILVKLTALLCLLHGRVLPVMKDFETAKAIVEGTAVIREHAHALASKDAEDDAYEMGRKLRVVDGLREEGKKARGGDTTMLDRAVNRLVAKVAKVAKENTENKKGPVSVREAKRALNGTVMKPLRAVGLAETAQDVLDEAVDRQLLVVDEKGVRLHT